ncbi:MAG: SDR family oxidoreductase [Pseudomonadota bacterium]
MTKQPSVLVTGAAKRVGKMLAIAFARHGWHIGVHYNSSHGDTEQAVAEIEAAGGTATLLQANLRDPDAVTSLIDQAQDLPNWQALVNSAAIFQRDRTPSITQENWHDHQAINLEAPMRLSQAFAAQAQAGANNMIVNVLDSKMARPNEHYISYSVSKAGLWYLTQAQALDLAPNIRVNAIGPGPTLVAPGQTDKQFEAAVMTLPLQRAPSAEEFESTIDFLLTARSVTGQMIALDGGGHLGWQPPARAQKA